MIRYDLQATFLNAAGIVPTLTGGVSLLPIWLKGDSFAIQRPWVHFEFCNTPFVDASCSTGTIDLKTQGHLWKLIVTPENTSGLLFDVRFN